MIDLPLQSFRSGVSPALHPGVFDVLQFAQTQPIFIIKKKLIINISSNYNQNKNTTLKKRYVVFFYSNDTIMKTLF